MPEVFAYVEDGGQVFIYMELIEGQTLADRWRELDEEARMSICNELRPMVKAWRLLSQETNDTYIGEITIYLSV